MGISFLYIGRDEHTLQDKLRLETPSELGFPIEMNISASAYRGPRGNVSVNTTDMSSLKTMLSRFDAATLSTIIPPGFNISEPYVTKPFNPIPYRRPAPNTASTKPASVPDFKVSDTTMEMVEGILKRLLPGIPRDFKFSKLYAPGGIIISEIEGLVNGIKHSLGIQDPSEEVFEGGHHRLQR
jgi:hypothetical protein